MNVSALRVSLALALVALLGACANSAEWSSSGDTVWTRGSSMSGAGRTAPIILGPDQPASGLGPLAPERLLLGERVTFLPWESTPDSVLIVERDTTTPDAEGRWRIKRLIGPASDPRLVVERTYAFAHDGSIALAEEVQHAEQVEVVFDPPLLIVPAGLAPGAAPIIQNLRMRVHPIGDRSKTRASGKAVNTVTYAADQSVRLASGPVTARRIESTLRADLTPATVFNRSIAWFVDGRGLIAEREEERTTVFNIPSRLNRSAWVVAP